MILNPYHASPLQLYAHLQLPPVLDGFKKM